MGAGLTRDALTAMVGMPGPELLLPENYSSLFFFMVSRHHPYLVSIFGLVHLDDAALRMCSGMETALPFLVLGSVWFVSLDSKIKRAHAVLIPLNFAQCICFR